MSNFPRPPSTPEPQNVFNSAKEDNGDNFQNNDENEIYEDQVDEETTQGLENIPFILWILGIAFIVVCLMFGNAQPLSHILFAIAATFSLSFSYRYPRQALWFFLIYTPFAGTVAYWIGNDHPVFHIAKDGFYIPALIATVQTARQQYLPLIIPKSLKIPLLSLLGISILTLLYENGKQQLSNDPGGQPILIGIFGLKVLMGYIPLILCAYILIRSRKELHFLTRLQVILAIICCVLGIIQYWLVVTGRCPDNTGLPEHLLLRANLQRKCLVGGALGYYPANNFIRLPGTFVAPWHWAWFLISSSFFSFASAVSDPKLHWRTLGWLSLSLVVLNSILCGQRTALLGVPIITIVLVIATSHITQLKRIVIIFLGVFLFIGGTYLVFPSVISQRIDSFVSRWNASPPTEFVAEQAQWSAKKHDGFIGNGLGRATNSARAFGETRLIETYYPKLLYEIGPLGVLAFLSVVTTLTVQGFKAYHRVKDASLRGYGVVFWVFVFLISYNSYWYPLDTDPVAVYYWFFAGVLFKIPQIERDETKNITEL
ncbi:MAG: hormogonium polysaccharide biosynthesis protein HpsL [Cyanobacteriota bacterium]|nr:hormogonium polysaccharide biosynthesis protein HpsL [Cyanobacteriota bacterium]